LIKAGERIPFDVRTERTIPIGTHIRSATEAVKSIKAQIEACESPEFEVDNPLSNALDLLSLRGSKDPKAKVDAAIISSLDAIKNAVEAVSERVAYVEKWFPRDTEPPNEVARIQIPQDAPHVTIAPPRIIKLAPKP
jgi:hypothetical protein